MSTSASGLIFDTEATGTGVEVFQPLQITGGSNMLSKIPTVKDGDDTVTLDWAQQPPQTSIEFTIDVDDTRLNSESGQIIVRGGEIEGATAILTHSKTETRATFTNKARADLSAACPN